MNKRHLFIGLILFSIFSAYFYFGFPVKARNPFSKTISTNENFINGMKSEIDTKNPKQVFQAVFANLDDEVTIYPSENYYYFELPIQGKFLKGNIGFSVDFRERGELTFGYDEVRAFKEDDSDTGGVGIFSEKDGVELKKVNPFKYTVTFQEKTVTFNLNQLEQKLDENIRLAKDEVFVGRSFDESGLKFFLIFNQKHNHFMWLLDEEKNFPETLSKINDEILIGNRTAFAFYNDVENNRKILIGVSQTEQGKNSWYDGPFDQLPDNYIASDKVQIQKYIEAAYPYTKGNINKFGIYLDDEGSRVAIAPYLAYTKTNDLIRLISGAKKNAGNDKSLFYCEITPTD